MGKRRTKTGRKAADPAGRAANRAVAEKLEQMANLLQQQKANPYRTRAYRRAAETLQRLPEDVSEIHRRAGVEGLLELANVGKGIASAIEEILRTGRWNQLERLRGSLDAVRLFQTIPAIGPVLAERIHDQLNIDTLEALENAAHDGSLTQVEGFGRRRLEAVRNLLDSMLSRVRARRDGGAAPPVDALLEVDRVYRTKAARGRLPRIAPKRFNPEGKAWLPVLHTRRGAWHYTALYSNTALAHRLGRTDDWVVVYYYDNHHREGQCTIVTETRGPLTGERVVRGREAECLALSRTRRPDLAAGRT